MYDSESIKETSLLIDQNSQAFILPETFSLSNKFQLMPGAEVPQANDLSNSLTL